MRKRMKELGFNNELVRKIRASPKKKLARTITINITLTIALIVPMFLYTEVRMLDRQKDYPDKEPWLRFLSDPSNSVTISWETSIGKNTTVQYDTNPFTLSNTISRTENVTMHHVNITGLNPNTQYYYRVGPQVDGEMSALYHFWTAPADQATSFTWLCISDTQESSEGQHHHPRVARALAKYNGEARFIGNGGDVANYGSSKRSWDYFFKCARPYAPYQPFAFALGNHDDSSSHTAPMYHQYFAFHENEPLYYSFNYSMLHYVSIPVPRGKESELTTELMSWLESDLANSMDKLYRVVIFHCPILSSGFFGRNRILEEHLHPIFDQYNVSLVINGHSHHYERSYMDGIYYVVAAGGGGHMDPCHNALPETQVLGSFPHYLKITCTTSSMTMEAISPEGSLFDQVEMEAP
ncbi:hypothetical protein GF325_00895 [Candidatus Bathyarchaeota archaeon]|nr:hypothetical protein [Candidatus Bathyarchaeota archaeon]